MDQVCPKTWAKRGIRAVRRIPADFRAPYCSILTNICHHHDEAVCRGWTVKQRRLGKLLLCIQGMLHKLENKEGEETDSKKAAAERAKQLHTRYRAFTTGDFGSILDQDNQKEKKGPDKPAQNKSSEEPPPIPGTWTPPEGRIQLSPTSGTATWAKRPRP